MKNTIKFVTAGLFALSTLSLAACNTVQGVAQDAQSAGQELERVAKDAE